jgi:nucleoside-diphosphate-sugar epimerase
LVSKLVEKGYSVKVLKSPSSSFENTDEKNVRYIEGDIKNESALRELLSGCDIVFHLAAKVHGGRKREIEEDEYYEVNSNSTELMVLICGEESVKRIVFYSTVGVYGAEADFHGDEESPCDPKTPYGKSKYIAEKYVLSAYENGGPEGVVLRFPIVYGAFDRGNVARLIKAVYHKYFFYFGDGNCLRSMISSRNTAEAAVRAALEPRAANRVFCVTDDKDYTLKEVVESICDALDTTWRPYRIPLSMAEWAGNVCDSLEKVIGVPFIINTDVVRKLSRSLTFSCENAKRILGYKPEESLIDGMTREVEWLKATKGWS